MCWIPKASLEINMIDGWSPMLLSRKGPSATEARLAHRHSVEYSVNKIAFCRVDAWKLIMPLSGNYFVKGAAYPAATFSKTHITLLKFPPAPQSWEISLF